MQPEQLIARPDALRLQTASCVEACDFGRPSVAAFNAGDQGLADAELSGDVFLHGTFAYPCKDGLVSCIEFGHALPLSSDDRQGAVGLLSFDLYVRAGHEQETLDIGSIRDRVAIEAPIPLVRRSPVFFNPPIAEPKEDAIQGGLERIREPQADTALIGIDFDAPLTIQKGGAVAGKCVRRIVADVHVASYHIHAKVASMAVPVMHWIGQRIEMVQRMVAEMEKAA